MTSAGTRLADRCLLVRRVDASFDEDLDVHAPGLLLAVEVQVEFVEDGPATLLESYGRLRPYMS